MYNVFARGGYIRSHTIGETSNDWDVLWTHDYPFSKMKDKLVNLKPHQKVCSRRIKFLTCLRFKVMFYNTLSSRVRVRSPSVTIYMIVVAFQFQVNHFPGSGFITNKAFLVSSKLKYTPKAFRIPSEAKQLREYATQHPDSMWVQKSSNHRGIHIKTLEGEKRKFTFFWRLLKLIFVFN